MAAALGLDAGAFLGTGANGRVTRRDVDSFIDQLVARQSDPLGTRIETEDALGKETLDGVAVRREKMTRSADSPRNICYVLCVRHRM